MEIKIKENIDKPEQLETLYQGDKRGFEKAFLKIYGEIADSGMARFWKARLDYDNLKDSGAKSLKTDILFLILICLITGFLMVLPHLFDIKSNEYLFYEKNAGLIVFMGLSAFLFLVKKQINIQYLIISVLIFLISAVYINILPSDEGTHSVTLAYIHLSLLLWCLYGIIFIDFDIKDRSKRIDYIKYNGDLAILTAIILIAGGILTVVTLGLFSAIGLDIERFYFDYIAIPGLASSPIVATYIVKSYPSVTNKIAPIIAGIFSPLVLITLVIYLISIVLTGKNPYNDRDFLIVFNLMLLGVMAIIVFSITGTSVRKKQRFNELTLLILSVFTMFVDLIALSAIIYRLGEYGLTPNRTAVLGSNLLILGNLVLIMIDLYKVCFKGAGIKKAELTISGYLPVYLVWTFFVTFGLPLIFGFK